MCGIVGFITEPVTAKQPSKHELEQAYTRAKFFKQALIFDTVRGEHSTGVMGFDVDGARDWYKNAVPGWQFVDDKDFYENWLHQAIDFRCMIGHNRAATMGAINTANAHPFEHGDITLVHNGTLQDLSPLEHQHKDIEVDSSLIAYNLSLAEPDDAGKVLSNLDGAYALVWLDTRDGSINIVRNSRRPLHMAQTRDKKTLYFMSEGPMLEMVLNRNKISYDMIYSLGTQQWLKFKKDDLAPEVRDVSPFVRPTYYGTPTSPYQSTRQTTYGSGSTSGAGATRLPKNKECKIPVGTNNQLVRSPKMFVETLRWFDMKIEDELEFEPDCFYSYPQSRHQTGKGLPLGDVCGEIWVPCMAEWVDCRLVGVGARLFEEYMNQNWTVRPVTITWDDGEMTVHAKFVAPMVTEEAAQVMRETAPLDDDIPFEDEGDVVAQLKDYTFYGPRGRVNREQYMTLVQDGCVMCTGNLPENAEDSKDVMWVGERADQPLCLACQEEATSFTEDF